MDTYLPDSNSVLNLDVIYPQHQAAITLIQKFLNDPQVKDFYWLDLLCGQGQILTHFKEHFSPNNRAKISYYAYDINVEYSTMACSLARDLNLKSVESITGHIRDFKVLCGENNFNCITITNGFHEISPVLIPEVISDSLCLLRDNGFIYLYDIEKLHTPELGAICFRQNEIKRITNAIINGFGIEQYNIDIAKWRPQKNLTSWSAILERDILDAYELDKTLKQNAIKSGTNSVKQIIAEKLEECNDTLEAIISGSFETIADQKKKIELLFEYHALKRYKEGYHE